MTRIRAMTLIEVLAVVCIIALAAALTLAGLGAASADTQLRTALAECRQLDFRGRLLARAEGPVVIKVTDDRDGLHAGRAVAAEATPASMRVQAPADWSIRLLDCDGKERSQLSIDGCGCSDDYLIELRAPQVIGSANATRLLRIVGLTGWVEEMAGP